MYFKFNTVMFKLKLWLCGRSFTSIELWFDNILLKLPKCILMSVLLLNRVYDKLLLILSYMLYVWTKLIDSCIRICILLKYFPLGGNYNLLTYNI